MKPPDDLHPSKPKAGLPGTPIRDPGPGNASGSGGLLTMNATYRTGSAAETIALGHAIALHLPRRAVVLLIGNLGAGKTTLAKGIVEGLGAASADEVSSPTFTLIHEYGNGRVYHVDLYRLDTREQVATLGLDEIFDRDAVVLIEWGERFPEFMPPERIEIALAAGSDAETRRITMAP